MPPKGYADPLGIPGHMSYTYKITVPFIATQATASIPGLKGIVPAPAQPVKAAVKFPLTTADRRFRSE